MMEEDQLLLQQLARLNGSIGKITIDMLHNMVDGQLPASALKALGRDLLNVGGQLCHRAAKLEGRLIEGSVVVEVRGSTTTFRPDEQRPTVEQQL
ncbi:hypothetical protein [Amycolatopsis palatopharyngis]|uniref:hypothetical protein n=1 Tax=Amycolatopsis palatopharyngis TaxID=187982 RepID=UPI000E2477E6|nr:hypothetical protein [Amycolatopsis palatopharyngis]